MKKETVEAIKNRVKYISKNIDELISAIEFIKERIKDHEKEISNLENEIEELNIAIDDSKKENLVYAEKSIGRMVKSLEGEIDYHVRNMNDSKEFLNDHLNDLSECEKTKEELELLIKNHK